MLFLDKPYISDFLLETIKQNALPIVRTEFSETVAGTSAPLVDARAVIDAVKADPLTPILTTSENAIGWVAENLSFLDLPAKIELFKNKVRFRELTASLHPDLFFREVALADLPTLDPDSLPYPLIVKPAVGFFSMGVHMIASAAEWASTVQAIQAEIEQVKGLYPIEVLNAGMFILEQVIGGAEYAIDAYFDADGQPVILGIFKHIFASEDDVSDRVYVTSKDVIEDNLADFTTYLNSLGALADVRNFAVHAELRRDETGTIRPIEVNPMRFGGWCTTADMTHFAYGFNPYLAFFRQEKPDWQNLLNGKEGFDYAIVVLDNSTGVEAENIKEFDYAAVASRFEHVMEIRRIDFHEYPVFGFLFTKTRQGNTTELTNILTSNLREFVSL